MNIIIGHNGSGKTKYIEDKYFAGKRLNPDEAHLKKEDGKGDKPIVFYMHAAALLKPMKNPKNALLKTAIQVDGWHSFVKFISEIVVDANTSIDMKKHIKEVGYYGAPSNWYDFDEYDSSVISYIRECLNYEDKDVKMEYKKVIQYLEIILLTWMKEKRKNLEGLSSKEMMGIFVNGLTHEIQFPLTEIIELFIAKSLVDEDLTLMQKKLNSMLTNVGLNFQFKMTVKNELYTKKRTFEFLNNDGEVDFSKLSTGEQTLFNLVLQIFLRTNAKNTEIPIIILDEIDAFLNAKSIKEIKEGVEQLANEVYFITHRPLSVALFNDEKYLLLENNETKEIEKNQAIDFLLSGINNINLRTYSEIIVYCESKYDAQFFGWQQKNQKNKLNLLFAPCSSSAAQGGKENVKMLANSFGKSQNQNMAFVVDWDGKEKEDLESQIFVNEERYSLENFLLDPFLLSFAHPKKKEQIHKTFNSLFDGEMLGTSYWINGTKKTEQLPKSFMNKKIKGGKWHDWVKSEIPSFQNNVYRSNFVFQSVADMMKKINSKNNTAKTQ